MTSDDLRAVLTIERNAQPSPWSRLSFEEALTRHHRCQVLEYDDAVVGYYISSAVLDEFHILNVVIAKPFQARGLAHVLMQDMFESAQAAGLAKMFLEVRLSNTIAQSLYEKWGFEKIALRKGYYSALPDAPSNSRDDALVYVRLL